MSEDKLRVLRKYLEDNLKSQLISPSVSPVSSPVLFVRKPGGGLRFCVDYRRLNALTIKNRYLIPLLSETLARLSRAKYFTKIDIIAAFNRLRIAEGDEWKTAFKTRYGLYQYNVLPFGLSNGPTSF
jgi:Reverse transcriptase (RNA-dependent DNA polymerase)